MPYLSKTPYIAPPFAEMEARRALMRGSTQAGYEASVRNVQALVGFDVSAIAYASDGLRVTGVEVLPSDLQPAERVPLMIYNRGGSGDYGMLSPGQISVLMAPFAEQLRCGVLASNYRGNGDSEGREEWGGADVHDVLNLLALGKQQPWWDGKNVFMLGWSRGGMMTYRAMQEGAQLNAAAVGAGVADLLTAAYQAEDMERVFRRFIPEYTGSREDALRARSAVCWPQDISAPLLLLHGDADDRVHVGEARDLHQKLQALGKPVRYVEYEGGNHALKRHVAQWQAEVVAWFTAHRV